ncbi:MAG TPA: VOC family protein [Streptosporangiaceae bacterium]|nr:VOC family protein [Streptosporangiaceae bacterium]
MLKMGLIVLGVTDMRRAVEFWTEALGFEVVVGGPDARWTEVGLAGPGGAVLAFQHSDVAPERYPRLHLDLYADDAADQKEQIRRLVALGASEVDWDLYPEDPDFVVLADPDGNRFCVVDVSHG